MLSEESSKDLGKLIKTSKLLIVVLIIFLIILSISALGLLGEISQDSQLNKTLSVTGTGEVFATPDVAQFTFTVSEEADSVTDAQEAVSGKADTAIESLKDLGIGERDIKTTSYNSFPRYVYPEIACFGGICPPRDRVLSGYEVSQTIRVKVRDAETASVAISKVAEAGISNIGGLQFVIDDQDVLLSEARDEAISDAKEKVDELAKSLGVRVKGVVNFSESTGDDGRYPLLYAESAGIGGSDRATLPTGENAVRVQVFITYEIK